MSYVELAFSLAAKDPQTLPSGTVKLMLKSGSLGTSKKGRKQFTFMFVAAQQSNVKPLFDYIALPGQGETEDIANLNACRMRDLKAALGIDPSGGINLADAPTLTEKDGETKESYAIDDPTWLGKECWAIVKEEEDDRGQNRNTIVRYVVGQ